MMLSFVEYDPLTGEIFRSGNCPAGDMHLQGAAVLWVSAAVDDTKYYVQEQKLVARPALPVVADAERVRVGEIVTFSGIPAGCVVTFAARSVTVDDGALEFSSATPGAYEFVFRCFPYREKRLQVEVSA